MTILTARDIEPPGLQAGASWVETEGFLRRSESSRPLNQPCSYLNAFS